MYRVYLTFMTMIPCIRTSPERSHSTGVSASSIRHPRLCIERALTLPFTTGACYPDRSTYPRLDSVQRPVSDPRHRA
ncbi:hypothetical protein DTO280E4_7739 [Paecilomyces variotii]|nr:hypothetical protein DTO032I3_7674 [Paecilomyces variotii]KAJ9275037.1 hypothetical protein DTO021D3_8112 [Paecilomyces variotii]KAJ9342387.1 hypothetical protein DTO027B6_5110 [Paecilomyces variotii]KAJ9352617.1 hypothetical protein DTO280E4_7739 [Paecilomyces variotii]KAJ9381295.1 hypothetical protein DTO032I4_6289 [Paecilomyces variotii]